MFLLNWYRELLQIKEEYKHVCKSCESLKVQIETLRYDNQQLLNALITKETTVEIRPDTSNLKPILPRMIPWTQRRQMLETEDRHTAALTAKKLREEEVSESNSNSKLNSVAEIERELGIPDAQS